MIMKKMMMLLQVSPISLSLSLTKPLLHTYRTKLKKRKKMLSPLHDKFHSTTAPFARVHTVFFFFPVDHFDDASYFNTKASVDPRFSWVCAVTRVCVTSSMLFIRYRPTGQKQV
ncbi:unnamed protein product [Ixodes pacificus]